MIVAGQKADIAISSMRKQNHSLFIMELWKLKDGAPGAADWLVSLEACRSCDPSEMPASCEEQAFDGWLSMPEPMPVARYCGKTV
ncbi:MAG: hypothetical protein ACLU4P_04325 [Ruminococcus sp.]